MEELRAEQDILKWCFRAGCLSFGAYQLNGALESLIDTTYRVGAQGTDLATSVIQESMNYGFGIVGAGVGTAIIAGAIANGINQLRRNRHTTYLVTIDGNTAAAHLQLLGR